MQTDRGRFSFLPLQPPQQQPRQPWNIPESILGAERLYWGCFIAFAQQQKFHHCNIESNHLKDRCRINTPWTIILVLCTNLFLVAKVLNPTYQQNSLCTNLPTTRRVIGSTNPRCDDLQILFWTAKEDAYMINLSAKKAATMTIR